MKASFLVRFWTEDQRGSGEQPVVRGYLRNLHTGEERYVEGPETVGDLISRHLEAGMAENRVDSAERDRAKA